MYPYRTVERALAYLHGDTGASAVRVFNRLKHLVRLGLTPDTPGKGRHISYSFEDAAKWAYALQILDYGVDPRSMLFVVQQTWEGVWRAMAKGNHGQNELLVATPNAISQPDGWRAFDFSIRQFQTYAPDWTEIERVMVINVSMISRRLREALDKSEAGTLRDLSAEIEICKVGDARVAHITAALQNVTPGAELHIGGINGGALVQERGSDGQLRDVLPTPRRPRGRPRKSVTST